MPKSGPGKQAGQVQASGGGLVALVACRWRKQDRCRRQVEVRPCTSLFSFSLEEAEKKSKRKHTMPIMQVHSGSISRTTLKTTSRPSPYPILDCLRPCSPRRSSIIAPGVSPVPPPHWVVNNLPGWSTCRSCRSPPVGVACRCACATEASASLTCRGSGTASRCRPARLVKVR